MSLTPEMVWAPLSYSPAVEGIGRLCCLDRFFHCCPVAMRFRLRVFVRLQNARHNRVAHNILAGQVNNTDSLNALQPLDRIGKA